MPALTMRLLGISKQQMGARQNLAPYVIIIVPTNKGTK